MHILLDLYLLALCAVLPLFMKNGFYELGEAKAGCFIAVSLGFFVLFFIGFLCKRPGKRDGALSLTRFFLYGVLFSQLISFVFSVDKKTAFFGYKGWRNGLLLSLLMILVSLSFYYFFSYKKLILLISLIIPAFEFILAILNRMGIDLLMIGVSDPGYLSTIGNINWYSGFLSVFVPLGMGILYELKERDIFFYMCILFDILGFMALLLQGSDGALLILIASFSLLLWFSLSDWESFRRFILVLLLLGISMSICSVLLIVFPESYNYDSNILITICKNHIGIIIVAASFFLYSLSMLFSEIKVSFGQKRLKTAFLCIYVISVLALIICLYNTFDDSFGNGRGIIWSMCLDIFNEFSQWQKMIGIGQDCLFPYVLKNEVWLNSFYNVFGNNVLTNAHQEILTVLIERGFIGAVMYLGLFFSAIYELSKIYKKESTALICALPIISYLVYNQVSFAQVMSTPYIFVLIGIAIGLIEGQSKEMGNRN